MLIGINLLIILQWTKHFNFFFILEDHSFEKPDNQFYHSLFARLILKKPKQQEPINAQNSIFFLVALRTMRPAPLYL